MNQDRFSATNGSSSGSIGARQQLLSEMQAVLTWQQQQNNNNDQQQQQANSSTSLFGQQIAIPSSFNQLNPARMRPSLPALQATATTSSSSSSGNHDEQQQQQRLLLSQLQLHRQQQSIDRLASNSRMNQFLDIGFAATTGGATTTTNNQKFAQQNSSSMAGQKLLSVSKRKKSGNATTIASSMYEKRQKLFDTRSSGTDYFRPGGATGNDAIVVGQQPQKKTGHIGQTMPLPLLLTTTATTTTTTATTIKNMNTNTRRIVVPQTFLNTFRSAWQVLMVRSRNHSSGPSPDENLAAVKEMFGRAIQFGNIRLYNSKTGEGEEEEEEDNPTVLPTGRSQHNSQAMANNNGDSNDRINSKIANHLSLV